MRRVRKESTVSIMDVHKYIAHFHFALENVYYYHFEMYVMKTIPLKMMDNINSRLKTEKIIIISVYLKNECSHNVIPSKYRGV